MRMFLCGTDFEMDNLALRGVFFFVWRFYKVFWKVSVWDNRMSRIFIIKIKLTAWVIIILSISVRQH